MAKERLKNCLSGGDSAGASSSSAGKPSSTLDADEMSGTLEAQFYSLSGGPISPVMGPGTSTGKRIEVEFEERR